MNLACVVIAKGSDDRRALLDDHILPSVLSQGFREVVVVGTHHEGAGYRYLHVPPVVGTTLDALIKRDVGAVATLSETLLYLSDDHSLLGQWGTEWPAWDQGRWDVLVPARYTLLDGALVELNNGMDVRDPYRPYCGGHAGLFRRWVLQQRPWMAAPHTLFWDLGHSRQVEDAGFLVAHCPDLRVCDIDPNPVEKIRHFTL